MARKSLLPGYERIKGDKAERVRNLVTGEIISDRQYKKLAREFNPLIPINSEGKKIVSNEALAKFNRETNPTEALARPARGRTSARKLSPEIQRERAQAEVERLAQAKRKAEQEKAAREVERKVEAAKKKKPKAPPKKINASSFKYDRRRAHANRKRLMAVQYDFQTFDELVSLHKEAKSYSPIHFWGWGWRGVSVKDGTLKSIWVDGLNAMHISPVEYEFLEMAANSRSDQKYDYIAFISYFVHFKKAKGT